MRKQIEQHLEEFLLAYQQKVVRELEAARQNLTLLALEKDLRRDYELGPETFHLEGKIDRIEKRGEYLVSLIIRLQPAKGIR